MRILLAMLTFAVALTLSACDRGPSNTAGPAFNGVRAERKPNQRRILLIGWDGMSRMIVDPLLERGELPNLKRLIDNGVIADLQTITPTHSPVIWTSLATSRTPQEHGIQGFWRAETAARLQERSAAEEAYLRQLQGVGYIAGAADAEPGGADDPNRVIMTLYDSSCRRTEAVWNILSAQGLTCDVLGWWATWPVEAISGHMVADRYLYDRLSLIGQERKGHYAPGGHDDVHPEAFREQIAALRVLPQDLRTEDMAPFVRGPLDLKRELKAHNIEDELRIVYAKDETIFRVARKLLTESRPDFLAAYIQGTDISCHYFLKFHFPREYAARFEPVAAAEVERYAETIDAYYRHQDRRLGELLALTDANTTIIVVSDHGFVLGKRDRGTPGAETVSGIHENAEPGVIVLSGDGIRRGATLTGAGVYDVLPTILALLGLPRGADMHGRPLADAFAQDDPSINLTTIPTYELGDRPGCTSADKTAAARPD